VIPARMGSSRFPGKSLLVVRGLPMVEHVRRRAVLSGAFSEVVVATCDREIADAVEGYGGRVLMTSASHPGALDRVAEAMRQLDCTHVVNVQGDEILVLPSDLRRVVEAVQREPAVEAWNAAAKLEHSDELGDPSIVKLLVSRTGRVLFCTRRYERAPDDPSGEAVYKSIGIMAFTRAFLERFVRLPRTPLERSGGMDQLRIVEHDLTLRTVLLARGYPTINEPREVALVEASLATDHEQQAVLEQLADTANG
jgi:3-deoxy-manno-octulosonate cytidylyltransferase (CMP-KDO synthetase)